MVGTDFPWDGELSAEPFPGWRNADTFGGMTARVPVPLQMAFDRWGAVDGPEDAPIVWRKPSWEKSLAHATPIRELLGGWPADLNGDPLTREKVTESAGKVTADDRAAQLTAFLAAMIWGYGRVGYGPSRVAKMLAEPRFLDGLGEQRGREQGQTTSLRDR